MKKTLIRHRTNIPKIPYSKTSINKQSVDASLQGQKMFFLKIKMIP